MLWEKRVPWGFEGFVARVVFEIGVLVAVEG